MKKWLMILAVVMSVAAYAHEAAEEHEHEHEPAEAPVGDGINPAYDTATPVPIAMYTDETDVSYKLEADPAQVFATPKWKGMGEPPLSVGTANEKAIAWLKETHPEFTSHSPETYTLQRVWAQGLDDRWVYTISIRVSGKLGPVDVKYQYQIAVLLDGTVVVPEKVQ